MCNIYKNNLIVLSKITENNDLYYVDNSLHIDDRYLTSVRSGKNINKINNIISNSFLKMCNNHIIFNKIDETNNSEEITEGAIDNYDDTYTLLVDSLNGFKNYITNLKNNSLLNDEKSTNLLENSYSKLDEITKSIDTIKETYTNKFLIEEEDDEEKKNCLTNNYFTSLYNSTIYNDATEFIEEDNQEDEEDSYIGGLFTIIGRKLGNFLLIVVNHIRLIIPF
tara:strand:- start:30 stop:698 length:669 start_codon:yes stop_codon:yes gene_type:complete